MSAAAGEKSCLVIIASVNDLTKIYSKPGTEVFVHALRGVDIQFVEGESVAICGQSGSGKSTLMNLLGCLDRPTSGSYLLDGRDVSRMDDDELSAVRGQRIGFVFQAFNLISQLNTIENVEVPLLYQGIAKHQRQKKAIQTLQLVGLGDRMGHRPRELSGGQQQRVAIARALVNDPAIIMADEPTGNLDSATGNAILETFENLHAQGMTIIIVTHDDDIADHCERIVRLRDGHVESDIMAR